VRPGPERGGWADEGKRAGAGWRRPMGEFRETRRTGAEIARVPGAAAGSPRPRRSSRVRRRCPAVTTATMCRRPPQMDMRFWLEQAEAEIVALRRTDRMIE
jgi:hypothetical protein